MSSSWLKIDPQKPGWGELSQCGLYWFGSSITNWHFQCFFLFSFFCNTQDWTQRLFTELHTQCFLSFLKCTWPLERDIFPMSTDTAWKTNVQQTPDRKEKAKLKIISKQTDLQSYTLETSELKETSKHLTPSLLGDLKLCSYSRMWRKNSKHIFSLNLISLNSCELMEPTPLEIRTDCFVWKQNLGCFFLALLWSFRKRKTCVQPLKRPPPKGLTLF